jgi:ribosomal-protein-alanine acetyltransferase
VFAIRKIQPEDVFSVIKLAAETLSEQYNPNLFNYFYETFPEGFWVAEKYYKIIGFIIGVQINHDAARILMLAVTEKQRRQGVGSALLNHCITYLYNQDIKNIELEVRTENKPALRFYQKHGFHVVRTVPKFYVDGSDAYIMKRVL